MNDDSEHQLHAGAPAIKAWDAYTGSPSFERLYNQVNAGHVSATLWRVFLAGFRAGNAEVKDA